MAITISCILILVLLSAFFSGSESALTGASEAYMTDQDKNEHNLRAKIVLNILSKRSKAVITTLIGSNICNTLGTALSTQLLVQLFGAEGVAYATLIMTFLILIYTYMLPKSYAVDNSNKAALFVAPFMSFWVWLFTPLVYVLQKIVYFSFKVFGIRENCSEAAKISEIRGAICMYDGIEIKEEKEMMKSILDLAEIQVYDVMNHRRNIYSIDVDLPIEKIIEKVEESCFSRIPVYKDKPENIIGIIRAKNFLKQCIKNKDNLNNLKINDLLFDAWFIPETTNLLQQMQEFQKRREHFALVVDEYGSLEGIITLEDIIEEIVGNIEDESDVKNNDDIKEMSEGAYIVDGQKTIRELNREFDWCIDDENAVTIAGYLLDMTQSIPEEGQKFIFDGFEFEIVKRTRNQLKLIKIHKIENNKVCKHEKK